MMFFRCAAGIILTFALVMAQPLHDKLLYEHSLMDSDPGDFASLENIDGTFVPATGWQADNTESQLRLTTPAPLPDNGAMTINVTRFDPVTQNLTEIKQHIINMYSRIYTNNKDVFETDGSWWNIRTGSYYSDGPGMAGFKFLAAPRGIDSRGEIRLLQSSTWDLDATYEFKVVWTTEDITIFLNGTSLATLPFSGQVEPFRYILIGQDNLIYGYAAQPGPIYFNLKIYGPDTTTIVDTAPPVLQKAVARSETRVDVMFDEPLDTDEAVRLSHYQIDNGISIDSAQIHDSGSTVQLFTSPHVSGSQYTLTVSDIPDRTSPANVLNFVQTAYSYFETLTITNLSPAAYEIGYKTEGDTAFLDRDYLFTDVPDALEPFPWVVTANDDKQVTDLDFLTFEVSEPVTVWLGRDVRLDSEPPWMATWVRTDLQLKTDDTDFNFYVRYFDAGTVTLGGNDGGESSSMYVLCVVPHSAAGPDTTAPAAPMNVRIIDPTE